MLENFKKAHLFVPLLFLLLSTLVEANFKSFTTILKALIVVDVILLYVSYNRKKVSVYAYFSLVLLIYLVLLTLIHNINFLQAIEDGIRYFFPLIAILYGSLIKEYKVKIYKIILLYIIINDMYQLLGFILKPIFFVDYNYSLHRAVGLVKFFDFFAFINFVGLVLLLDIKEDFPYKKYFIVVFILFILWSLSYKMILFTIIFLGFKNYKLLLSFLLFIPVGVYNYKTIFHDVTLRFNRYIMVGDSARSESYRVLFNNINDFILLGKGPGVFGGPASTKYHSDFYNQYSFNWHYSNFLATTDTYYPHLFIELGVVFSLIYLYVIVFLPLIQSKYRFSSAILILVLIFNSIFTFSLNSLEFCFFSLMLVFVEDKVTYE